MGVGEANMLIGIPDKYLRSMSGVSLLQGRKPMKPMEGSDCFIVLVYLVDKHVLKL